MSSPPSSVSFEPLQSQELVAGFLATLKDDDLSPKTIRAYRYNLEGFLAWLHDSVGSVPPTYQDAASYRNHLIEEGRAVSSVNQALAAIRRFLVWGKIAGLLTTEGKVRAIREIRIQRPAVDARSTRRLLDVLEREASARDKALLICGIGLGLRISEVCSLRLRDIQFTPRTITVKVLGKGRVSREVQSSGDKVRGWVLDRVREIEETHGPDRDRQYLIGVKPSFATELVHNWGNQAGIVGLHPHQLRRTYGQIRRKAGAPIEVVAREMGHSRLDTTAIYTTPEGQEWDVVEEKYL